MTILILIALFVLVGVFAVFFLLFKVLWLLLKKNSYKGPLIGAGICTLLCAIVISIGVYTGYKAVTSPFKEIMANVATNPKPVYGERTYQDDTYPFELSVYDGMDFSKWISLGDMQLKLGMDTNAFKKNADGKKPEDILFSVLLRQQKVNSKDPFGTLQNQLTSAQDQRRIELTDMRPTEINGLPAYQASGEAYSNRGKLNFWLSAVQTQPDTVMYVCAFSLQNTDRVTEQAQQMTHSVRVLSDGN